MKAFKQIAKTTAGYFVVFTVMFTTLAIVTKVSFDIATGVLI